MNVTQAIIKGNPKIYKTLRRKYFQMVKDIVTKMGSKNIPDDAEDVFSETSIALYKNIASGKVIVYYDQKKELVSENMISGEKSKLGTYLYGIARNKWSKAVFNDPEQTNRDNIDEQTEKEIDFDPSPENQFDKELHNRFNSAFHQLKPRCKLILTLQKKAKLDQIYIAGFLGITHGALRNAAASCMKQLYNLTQCTSPEAVKKSPIIKYHMDSFAMELIENINSGVKPADTEIETEILENVFYKALENETLEKLTKLIIEHKDLKLRYKLLKILLFYLKEIPIKDLSEYKQDKKDLEKQAFLKQSGKILNELFYQKLGVKCQILLILHDSLGEKISDIAEMLEFNNDISAKKSMYQCKTKILKNMSEHNELLKLINN